jgi:putative transposase
MQMYVKKKTYPSDMSKNGWKTLQSQLPASKSNAVSGGRPSVSLKEVINGILYALRTGCQWRSLPHDFPRWQTVYGYYRRWCLDGTWTFIHNWLVKKTRIKVGREATPTAGSLDSQSVKTVAFTSEAVGYDGGKKIKGRKRFILVDTMGLLVALLVCGANVSEKAGAQLLLTKVSEDTDKMSLSGRIQKVWVDGGYRGDALINWVMKLLGWTWQITLRSDGTKGFKVIPKRWVVERTFGWLGNYRRLSKDYEKTTWSSESMLKIAMIDIMLNRL